MKLSLFVAVLLCTLTYCAQGEGPSADLSVLSAKFQSMINELGKKTERPEDYSQELTSMLQRLQLIQAPATNRTIALDWYGTSETFQAAPLRIVLVVSSFEGVYLNSGIGTFYSALTDFLVSRGHRVTVLYTNKDKSEIARKKFDTWKAYNEKRGVEVMKLAPSTVHVTSPTLTQTSYQVYLHLKERQEEFDVVHFPDWEGPGYFSMLAKHQGLAFSSKVLVVGLHGPWRWVKYANQDSSISTERDVETDWLEQRSVEMADMLVTPSKDLPQWLAGQGWTLPDSDNIFLLPFLAGKEVVTLNQRDREIVAKTKVKEIVFFGRLEARKGLKQFVDALDTLALRLEPEFKTLKVTFLGKPADIDGKPANDYINERAKLGQWGFTIHFIAYKDRKQSLEYLMGHGRLAVMPSLVDNAPYTVYECLYMRIPFVASDLPSIAAIVHSEDRAKVLFTPEAAALATILTTKIELGAAIARSSLKPGAAGSSWERFYHQVAAKLTDQTAASSDPTSPANTPLVSVCIPYYNRPHLLPMAIQSIKDQQYPASSIEIVLVDDGSTNQDAIDYIDSLKPEFDANGWQIIRTENKYLGAARNTAARAARGEYLLFLDDDNIARPTQLATYAAVARATTADVVTAAHDVFRGQDLPDETPEGTNIVSRSVALGAAVAVGIFKNCFGDANFFVKRDSFLSLGGFTEERDVGQEDYEFFANAVLKGQKLEAIPESLLYYRMHKKEEQMMFNTNPVENQVRSLRPYASLLDEDDMENGEVLKVLAHRRVEALERDARADVVCNMTVTNVSPTIIYVNNKTELTFTANTIDCTIITVYIGSYQCSDLVTTASSFRCTTPSIPFAGKYAVSVAYAETSAAEVTAVQVLVVPSNVQLNSAVLVGTFTVYDLSKYTSPQVLYDLFQVLLETKSISFSTIEDILLKKTARSTTGSEQHTLKFTLFSPQNVSAASAASQLVTVVRANNDAFAALGVSWLNIDATGGCTLTGGCYCTPNYAGVDCSESASCPNNCSSNGECADGRFGRVCNCYKGHVGQDCSFTACLLDCSGHGTCLLKHGADAACQCDLGWSDPGCSTASNCPQNCNGFGTCNQGVCLCVSGRSGVDCSNYGADAIQKDTTDALVDNNDTSSDSLTIWLAVVASVVGALFIVAIILAVYLRHERNR